MSALGAHDWRPDFAAANPTLPSWFLDDRTDLTLRLVELRMPVTIGDFQTRKNKSVST
ncbi:hypothetical protein [Pseudomonas frederiksbergensis]|uniref:hypothetical protein n=1 Tax=Pseudomonas frederiksbergensis TaxID=104087 RepID=UPI002181FAC7|nr:hypothetical protein [Pseudomonas frederiksbergensis]